MARTATRPIPAGRVSPRAALTFGCTLAALSLLGSEGVRLRSTFDPSSRGGEFLSDIGTMFSQMNGGLSNGFLARNNLATTAGLRFRF